MKKATILLMGEQPAPNLLPTRHLAPDVAVLVYTARTQSKAENLKTILQPNISCLLCSVSPYTIPEIQNTLQSFLSTHLPQHALIFNLTGGTKPMVLAAYMLAQNYGAPFVYFQTEGNRSRLYHYASDGGGIVREEVKELSDTITLDDYLRLYLREYGTGESRNPFEHQVQTALQSIDALEVLWSLRPKGLGALEVDFVVRLGNQIGVGEVKSKGTKSGIDQINAVATQRYLGTYVKKFLVSGRPMDQNNKELAQAYRIEVIELPSYHETSEIDEVDRRKLAAAVVTQLGGRS
jgi:hypothetical protein